MKVGGYVIKDMLKHSRLSMEVRDSVRNFIRDKSLTRSSVAEQAGFTCEKFYKMLEGRALILAEDIIPICKALEITPNELFGFGAAES